MASIVWAVFFLVGLQTPVMAMVLIDVDVDINVDVDSGGYHKPSADLRPVQTGDICQDCTQIFELLMDMLSNADVQKKIINSLDTLCDHLPGPSSVAKLCREQVEKFFPLAITIITGAIKPRQVCVILSLCDSQAVSRQDTRLLSPLLKGLTAAMTEPQQVGSFQQCTLCKVLIQTLERMLPKERTEGAVLALLGEVCSHLPSFLQTQCESLIDRYGKILLDKLLAFASPEAICTFIHMCKGQETTPEEVSHQSDCDSCVSLVALSHLQLTSNSSSQLQTSSFLPTICQLLPSTSWPKCEAFNQLYGHQLQGLLGKQVAPLDVCRALGLCRAVLRGEGEEPRQGGDPCTLSSYRCKDMKTAHHCGTVWFCKRFVWKTEPNNVL